MRSILFSIIALLSISAAIAGDFSVKFVCDAGDVSSIHRFEMVGEAMTNCDGLEILAAEVNLFKAKAETPTLQLSDVFFQGNLKHFTAGQLTNGDVFQLKATKQPGSIEAVNILLGYPAGYSSSIRTADGYLYRAKCTLVD